MHDDPVNEFKNPAGVGLAIKGVDTDDISRGDVLCSEFIKSKGNNRCRFYSCRIYQKSLS